MRAEYAARPRSKSGGRLSVSYDRHTPAQILFGPHIAEADWQGTTSVELLAGVRPLSSIDEHVADAMGTGVRECTAPLDGDGFGRHKAEQPVNAPTV